MIITFLYALLFCFLLEMLYFQIANRFHIIDKPNERSSHSTITIRGGGVIFPFAIISGIIIYQPALIYLVIAVFLIGTISFLDDIITLSSKIRISIHLASVSLILFQISTSVDDANLYLNPLSFILVLSAFIIIIGMINAYNFMDGINGMTVLYSLVTLISFWFIQHQLNIPLLDNNIFLLLLASLVVFGFFNLRKKAKTFTGDVGSISIALLFCFLLVTLMVATENLKWILLLGIYGLDAVATIICRIIRKENIFEAHRSHFYQYLANEQKWSHVLITIIFSVFQILLNLILIFTNHLLPVVCTYLTIIIIYIMARLRLEGKKRLFENYNTM